MAAAYVDAGLERRRASFSLYFRRAPSGQRYAIACGLGDALTALERFRFHDDELAYLAGLTGADGHPLLPTSFLQRLSDLRLELDVHAMPEGTLVFPHEPILRIEGPLWQAQLVETLLLNVVNFQTLVATKAHRIVRAARGKPVLELGLRRAQGADGGLSASRAAYVGGVVATSNVLAGMRFGIPVRGTHAHSWVMAFDDELEAFRAYAKAMPGNVIFLIDTYDTLQGTKRAIAVGRELRAAGHRLLGVRLDSGDITVLSTEVRKALDEAGFHETQVIVSNDLDEKRIEDLESSGCPIDAYGVGTQLVTCGDQPALGGVYKLTALQSATGAWMPKVKRSESSEKTSLPGVHGVKRVVVDGRWTMDVIHDTTQPYADGEEVLQHAFGCEGTVGRCPTLADTRALLSRGLGMLDGRETVPVQVDGPILQARAGFLAKLGA